MIQSSASTATATVESRPRMDWIDNLRTAMIVLAVNLHACVTYSWIGSWYYISPGEPSMAEKIPFGIWEGHLQGFFMGLMFFVAGYFADRSLRKRSSSDFLRERGRRLGIPTLIFMLLLHPIIVIGLHPGVLASKTPLQDYWRFVSSGQFVSSSGPMWFAFALLIFSVVFAVVRPLLPEPNLRPLNFKGWHFAVLGIAVGLASFLVRTVQPLGTTQFNFQLCYFAQYLVAFPLGIWVSRRDVLTQIATHPVARAAGYYGIIGGPLVLLAIALVSPPLKAGTLPPHLGGWNWYALAFALWEQTTGFCIGLGSIYFFARFANRHNAVSQWMADRSFGVYLFHAPILVWLSMTIQPWRTEALVMAAVMTGLAVAGAYALTDIVRRVPVLKTVI